MARDKDPAPTQSPIAHTDRAIVRTVHGRMIGSLSEAERDLLRRTNALLSEIALAGVQVDSVKAGTQILSKLRKTVYEDMNQLQHEALVLESARWLEEHVMNGKPGQWSWNPHQTGTIDDPDLECDFVGTRIVAEATTSLKPEGTIDSRMAATLSKLAEMSGDRYYFVRTEAMKIRRKRRSRKLGGASRSSCSPSTSPGTVVLAVAIKSRREFVRTCPALLTILRPDGATEGSRGQGRLRPPPPESCPNLPPESATPTCARIRPTAEPADALREVPL